jgi:hypothetical protein
VRQQREPDAHGHPVDRGHQRLVERLQRLQQDGEARLDGLARGQPGHLAQVLAGAEGAPRTGEHDHADCVVGPGGVERGARGPVQRRVEGVERLGPVEGQQADGIEGVHPDESAI